MKLIVRLSSGLTVIAGLLLWVAPVQADTGTHVVLPGLTHGISVEALQAALRAIFL